jgi:hypothetical protein
MKVYGGCIDPHFLELGTSWRWVVSFTLRLLYFRGKTRGTHWIGGWVDPRAFLDDVEKRKFLTLPGLELRHLDRPARSQSLYRLRYPGSSQRIIRNSEMPVENSTETFVRSHVQLQVAQIAFTFIYSHRSEHLGENLKQWFLWTCRLQNCLVKETQIDRKELNKGYLLRQHE